MTNKKFSIRKLAVGTASVAIGFSASGTIDSILANDYTNNYTVTTNTTDTTNTLNNYPVITNPSNNYTVTTNTSNNYTVTTNPSNNYMYNSNNNRNHPLSPEEYTLKQAKDRALEEIQPYRDLYISGPSSVPVFGIDYEHAKVVNYYIERINNSKNEYDITQFLQELKNDEQTTFNSFLSSLKNLTTEDLKELNVTITDKEARNKAFILNELYQIQNIEKDDFNKYRDEILKLSRVEQNFMPFVKSQLTKKKLIKDIYNSSFLSNKKKSEFLNIISLDADNSIHLINYSFNTIKKLSENKDISNAKKEALITELIKSFDYNTEDNNTNSWISKIYHLLSVIRSLNEQYEIKNNINNEPKPEENKTTPEDELSLSNKKVIAYDFLKGLTYPNLEKLRADIINATEEDIYSLSHKASAIKQISSIKNLNNNDKERYINEILEADLRSDLSTIVGKVLENDIIETSNLSDKQKRRLKEILNSLSQTNYNTFSDIISSALAINESKDLSSEEKEAFFDEFINKYKSPINQDTPSLDYETLYKMDVSILINKLSYLTDEDKKLYKEKLFAQKPGFGFAGAGELEYRIGFFTKDKILKNSEYTLESIKEFDAYKEAVAKNEELRKKKESEPTFDSKTENADIPFETIYKEDNTLDKGTEVTETEGINGVKEITTTYIIINGVRQDNPKVEEKVTKEKVDKVVRRGTKVTSSETEKSTQNIPFETIYKDDNSLDKGKEVVITEGINGTKEITTTYTVINGIRQDNPKVEEKVTKEKVDKVVRRGTKVSTTTTPELPNNTNKPISSSTNNSKPNSVTPTDKPVNSSTNDSKPNSVTPADKPADDNSKPTLANITLENINNDISVTLATAETGVKLVTDEVTNPTTLNEVKEKITNENNSITSTTDITNLRVVDLTLEKEGKKYSTNANRTVRIALLNNEKGNEILVYHVKDNGELEELTKEKNNLTITNDSVEFAINHFSKFAVASIKKNIPTPSTNTSEEHNKNKDTRRDLTDIKPSESNQNKILPRTGVSSSSTVLLGATLLSLALISRKLKKN